MWTSSDHHLAPPMPGGRGRLWSALLLLAVGVVTLAVLAVVAIAVVLGGYQKPREFHATNKKAPPSASWGEEVFDEQPPPPPRLRTHHTQKLQTANKPIYTVPTTTTTKPSTTTTSTSTTTNAPIVLPTYKVQGSVDFDSKQQRRDWDVSETPWRTGEVAVIQGDGEVTVVKEPEMPEMIAMLPSRSYTGVHQVRLPTLFPPTEKTTTTTAKSITESPRFKQITTDIPALDLGIIDSISKSFTNLAIRVRPQHESHHLLLYPPPIADIAENSQRAHTGEGAQVINERDSEADIENTTTASIDDNDEANITTLTMEPQQTNETMDDATFEEQTTTEDLPEITEIITEIYEVYEDDNATSINQTFAEERVDDVEPELTVTPASDKMTSRAAVERTAKQDPPLNNVQDVQREPKSTLLQAFPKTEFNSAPAFLRNRKRNSTTLAPTTTTEASNANCTCASRLEAQGLGRKLCDGVVDCWDYSDEESCEWCAPGHYVCVQSKVCVPRNKVCDGKRDCPFGDDERTCVSIAPDRLKADTVQYHDTGFLMVQKSGAWGPLCVEKLEGTSFRLADVARAVCRSLTYSDFELAEQVQVQEDSNNGLYYELNLQSARRASGSTPRLAVSASDCPSHSALRIGCKDLQCGVRPLAVSQWASPVRRRASRIVGGGNAGTGAWPWQVALYKEGQFQCGGSLVAAQWILSASHCFAHNLDAYWVARLGALRRGTDLASPFEQLRRVMRIIQHPGYLDHGFVNDLALLRLEKPVSFSDYIRPVCLPIPDTSEPGPEGQMCTVVGWGQLSEIGRIFPDTLQEVQLPLISTEECRKRTLFLPLYRVTEDMFCAGFERGGRDACLGDSGGPLMCQRTDGRWELTGITSNGYGCARAHRPGVYTKVANYMRWISQVISEDRVNNSTPPSCPSGQVRCALGHCSAPPTQKCGKLYCPAA